MKSLISENTTATIFSAPTNSKYHLYKSDIIVANPSGEHWQSNAIAIEDKLQSITHIDFYDGLAKQYWVDVPADYYELPLIVITGKGKPLNGIKPTFTYILVNPVLFIYHWLCCKTKSYPASFAGTEYPGIEATIKRAICKRALSLRTAEGSILHHFFVRSLVDGIVS